MDLLRFLLVTFPTIVCWACYLLAVNTVPVLNVPSTVLDVQRSACARVVSPLHPSGAVRSSSCQWSCTGPVADSECSTCHRRESTASANEVTATCNGHIIVNIQEWIRINHVRVSCRDLECSRVVTYVHVRVSVCVCVCVCFHDSIVCICDPCICVSACALVQSASYSCLSPRMRSWLLADVHSCDVVRRYRPRRCWWTMCIGSTRRQVCRRYLVSPSSCWRLRGSTQLQLANTRCTSTVRRYANPCTLLLLLHASSRGSRSSRRRCMQALLFCTRISTSCSSIQL